jgi:hypothetical protein
MDGNAYNFNHDAEKDNGSCLYNGNLQVNLTPKFNGEAISFDSVYHNISGYRIRFSSIKFYTTDALAINGSTSNEANSVARFDYSVSNVMFNGNVTPGTYTQLDFNIGVDSVRNHSDPASFPNDNPLNIIDSSGMFWTWNSGYIFVVIEGQYDTDSLGTGMPTVNFSYHIGKDPYLRTNSAMVNFTIAEKTTTELNYELNMEKFFYSATDTLDVDVNPVIHSTSGQLLITEFLADNFNNNLILE